MYSSMVINLSFPTYNKQKSYGRPDFYQLQTVVVIVPITTKVRQWNTSPPEPILKLFIKHNIYLV